MTNRFEDHVTRNFEQNHDACYPNLAGYCSCPLVEVPEDVADLVCSDDSANRKLHRPLIDFDLPVKLVPSGTPGNSHLYIDKAISFELYLGILKALAEADIVQWGFYDATQERGYGSLRHPDRPKECASTTDEEPF